MSNNLRTYRLKHKYTQTEVGKKLGLTVSGYQKIESGINKLTSDKLEMLSKLYGVSINELLGQNYKPSKVAAAESFAKAYRLSPNEMDTILKFTTLRKKERSLLIGLLNKHLE